MGAAGGIADEAQRLAGAALHERRLIGSAVTMVARCGRRSGQGRTPPSAHFRSASFNNGVSSGTLQEPDTPDSERRSPAHTRFRIGQQPAKVEIRR
jgi:hypothetical protein